MSKKEKHGIYKNNGIRISGILDLNEELGFGIEINGERVSLIDILKDYDGQNILLSVNKFIVEE